MHIPTQLNYSKRKLINILILVLLLVYWGSYKKKGAIDSVQKIVDGKMSRSGSFGDYCDAHGKEIKIQSIRLFSKDS